MALPHIVGGLSASEDEATWVLASYLLSKGIGGGLQPSEQAILANTFSPRQRGMAFAIYGIAVVTGLGFPQIVLDKRERDDWFHLPLSGLRHYYLISALWLHSSGSFG